MLSLRDASTVRSAAIAVLDAAGSAIRTETGEPIIDLVDAFSQQAEKQSVIAAYVEAIGSIAGWRAIIADTAFKLKLAEALGVSSDSLDRDVARRLGVPDDLASDIEAIIYYDLGNFASSFGRSRNGAIPATGVERLYLASSALFTALRGAGLGATVANGTTILYETSADLTNITPSFDSTRNQYYVDVSIKCRTAGKVGNRPKNTVRSMQVTIPGVVQVTNPEPIKGGLDRESNEKLLDALDGVLGGTDINTRQGLINYISSIPGVQDVRIVGPGDPLMERSTAGAIDIYIIGNITQTATVQVLVNIAGETFYLPYQPALAVSSVVGAVIYGEGGGYLFNQDTDAFAGSAQSVASITWIAPPGGPAGGEMVTVGFTYNSLVRDTQRKLDEDPTRNVVASSILVKQGTELQVVFQMAVISLPDITQAAAEAAVQDAINNYMTDLGLGQLVEYSELLAAAQNAEINDAPAIDRIDGFKLSLLGGALDVNNILPEGNEYGRLWDITFLSP